MFGLVAGSAAAVMTLLTLVDWKYGTGFSFRTVITNLTRRQRHPESPAPPRLAAGVVGAHPRGVHADAVPRRARHGRRGARLAAARALVDADRRTEPASPASWFARCPNINRAFPDIAFALVFVAVVGIGTLAGFLALFFFSIAVVTKLTSDTLDGVDTGPVEAATAAGARHNQMLRSTVVPQILPAYTSYVLYSFELNLRASAVIGLVGAGGIGQRLNNFTCQLQLGSGERDHDPVHHRGVHRRSAFDVGAPAVGVSDAIAAPPRSSGPQRDHAPLTGVPERPFPRLLAMTGGVIVFAVVWSLIKVDADWAACSTARRRRGGSSS